MCSAYYNATQMRTISVSSVFCSKYGKKWHFITDYAFFWPHLV